METTLIGAEKVHKENSPNYYSLLGISTGTLCSFAWSDRVLLDATESMIRSAYRNKAILYHPDKDPTVQIHCFAMYYRQRDQKALEWKQLCDAYEILLNPELKADYVSCHHRSLSTDNFLCWFVVHGWRQFHFTTNRIHRKSLCPLSLNVSF